MFLCPSRESLGLLNLGKVAAKYEEAWAGDEISGNDYGTITDLCVTILPLSHDD